MQSRSKSCNKLSTCNDSITDIKSNVIINTWGEAEAVGIYRIINSISFLLLPLFLLNLSFHWPSSGRFVFFFFLTINGYEWMKFVLWNSFAHDLSLCAISNKKLCFHKICCDAPRSLCFIRFITLCKLLQLPVPQISKQITAYIHTAAGPFLLMPFSYKY